MQHGKHFAEFTFDDEVSEACGAGSVGVITECGKICWMLEIDDEVTRPHGFSERKYKADQWLDRFHSTMAW